MLLLASKESLDGTLGEINFIVRERPQQHWAAQAAAYELALRDLEKRTILQDIGRAHQQLELLLPPKVRTLNSRAEMAFRYLDDASQEAASYHAQTDKRDRHEALERMIRSLLKIHTRATFSSTGLNRHLYTVVNQWRMLAEQGKETLQSISGRLYIDNPYAPGNPLELGDPLFMGRNDVVQKLGQALQKKYRPTFLLTGERRMGKSSILKQLPVLLGPRYLPVFYDLQTPGMIASTAAFFATIAARIERQLRDRSLPVQKLERSLLDDAQQQRELQVYDLFDQWFAEVEQALEQVDRVLILTFDEFEKLEDAEERGTINLNLLFNWFRSVIHNRPHLALLFSGAKMVGDMGRSWAGYFVNVELIKVSFLRPIDAHKLIVHPRPNIFNEETAREIMYITHCQPFLIQAVCKHIVENLNESSREQVTLEDVSASVKEVFESWGGYFWDLWDRCDVDQRSSLLAWYEVALQGGGLNVIGFSLPGTPGVIIGHNNSIAWGITNVEADNTDLYMETLDPVNHPGRYLYNHQWLPLQTHQEIIRSRDTTKPFVITVSATIHGPILNSVVSNLKGYTPVSLKWTLLQPEYTLTGFFQLDFATKKLLLNFTKHVILLSTCSI